MKRNDFIKYFLTFTTIPAMALTAIAGVDYDAGMNAYNKGDYNFAKILFQKAIKTNYHDVNARYMYAQILSREKNYSAARNEYQTIIKLAPSSQAATLAKQGTEQIDAYNKQIAGTKQNVNSTSAKTASSGNSNNSNETATDYLKNAYRGGIKYLRPRGMARIYIESDSTFKPMMQKAYSEWQTVLGSNVMFTYSGNKEDATDIVSFSRAGGGKGMQEGGNCQYDIQENFLKGSKIVINAYDSTGKPMPKEIIYHTMLHEIGHSIGIMGHSPYKGDVMSQGSAIFLPHLSQRDKNTVKLLYKDYGKQPTKEDIHKAKTEELTDIAKRVANHPSGYMDMGDELFVAGKYEEALEWYRKAENIKPSVAIYSKQIKAFDALKDTDNVVVCYKKILRINSNNKVAINNLLAIYQKQNRYKEGKIAIDSFLEKNPDMAKDPDIMKLKKEFSEEKVKEAELRQKLLNGF